MPATPVWLAAIESVLNRSIGRSQKAEAAARRLDRTSLQVDIQGIARIRAAVCANRLALTADRLAPTSNPLAPIARGDLGAAAAAPGADAGVSGADAVISGSPFALFNLLTGGAAHTAGGATSNHPRPAARIVGDAEVAERYRELFALARPDLEEELSRLIGDLPARRLSLAAQGALGWVKRFGRTARENVAEYLQEESRDLVAKPEVEEFVQGVDRLRDTAERVEARLLRIEQRLKVAP
jgi:ubiquinone biosynthesis protein UbiJ